MRTILIAAANRKRTVHPRLDEQVNRIGQGLERTKEGDRFKVVVRWAVTDDDVRRELLDNEPEVVHFAGQ